MPQVLWVALGLDIAFHTAHDDPPEIGTILMDPRGRRFGFDPLTMRGCAELPQAEGSIDCDDSNGKHACGGFVQVCGAVSGAHRIEIIAQDRRIARITVWLLRRGVKKSEAGRGFDFLVQRTF